MIRLLVGSYVQKPGSGFFSYWSRNNTCGLLSSDQLSYFNQTSGQKLVRKLNGSNEASFCEDKFSFVFVEAPTNFSYNSLKAEGCSDEDVLAVKFSQWVS